MLGYITLDIKKESTMKKFGKFMTGRGTIFNPVPQNEEEALQHGNALAHGKNSNYPVGTSECFNVGISGGCGPDCFVYQKGECEVGGEMIENHPATSLADSCSIGDVAEVKGGSQDGVVIAKDSLWQFISRLETELEMFESGDIHSHNLGCTKLKLDIRILKGLGGVS